MRLLDEHSRQHLLNHTLCSRTPVKALVQPLVEIGQPRVVQSHQVQDRRVEIADVAGVFDGLGESQLVGGARLLARPSRRQPGQPPVDEAMPVVIAARFADAFAGGRAAEFAAPDQQRFVPQSGAL